MRWVSSFCWMGQQSIDQTYKPAGITSDAVVIVNIISNKVIWNYISLCCPIQHKLLTQRIRFRLAIIKKGTPENRHKKYGKGPFNSMNH
jgi:hypothetical protein